MEFFQLRKILYCTSDVLLNPSVFSFLFCNCYPPLTNKSSCSLLCLHDSINITLYKNTSTFTLSYVWWFSFFWFSHHITAIIKDRFFSGTFPGAFKVATFSAPSLKKLLCGSNSIANYHAISNLLFLAKVLEKIFCS